MVEDATETPVIAQHGIALAATVMELDVHVSHDPVLVWLMRECPLDLIKIKISELLRHTATSWVSVVDENDIFAVL